MHVPTSQKTSRFNWQVCRSQLGYLEAVCDSFERVELYLPTVAEALKQLPYTLLYARTLLVAELPLWRVAVYIFMPSSF